MLKKSPWASLRRAISFYLLIEPGFCVLAILFCKLFVLVSHVVEQLSQVHPWGSVHFHVHITSGYILKVFHFLFEGQLDLINECTMTEMSFFSLKVGWAELNVEVVWTNSVGCGHSRTGGMCHSFSWVVYAVRSLSRRVYKCRDLAVLTD